MSHSEFNMLRGFSFIRMDDCEAVIQAVSASTLEIFLATASGTVRRIPGGRILSTTLSIMVPDPCTALSVTGPVAAGCVTLSRSKCPVQVRSSHDVVHVRAVPAAIDGHAYLTYGRFFVEICVVSVELLDVVRHENTQGIVPWTVTNSITGIYGVTILSRVGAEIGVP